MQHGIGRATSRSHAGDRVLKCLPDKNIPRSSSVLQKIHHQLAAVKSNLIFRGIHGWNAVETHGRQTDHLHHCRHRVRGVLSTARSSARACDILQFAQFRVSDFSCSICAHGFEDVLNRDIFAFVASGRDRAAIKNKPRKVHSRQGHRCSRDGLVAANHANGRVKHLPTTNQFDGVCNDLPAYQRSTHAFGAHGFAVRDCDGVELHRRAT